MVKYKASKVELFWTSASVSLNKCLMLLLTSAAQNLSFNLKLPCKDLQQKLEKLRSPVQKTNDRLWTFKSCSCKRSVYGNTQAMELRSSDTLGMDLENLSCSCSLLARHQLLGQNSTCMEIMRILSPQRLYKH